MKNIGNIEKYRQRKRERERERKERETPNNSKIRKKRTLATTTNGMK